MLYSCVCIFTENMKLEVPQPGIYRWTEGWTDSLKLVVAKSVTQREIQTQEDKRIQIKTSKWMIRDDHLILSGIDFGRPTSAFQK